MKRITGFSKLSRAEKVAWLAKHFFTSNPMDIAREFAGYMHSNAGAQKLFEGISENTLTNFYLPYGVAPNFLINGREYAVPMVIEESSVVAAAASAAKYWMDRGGFKAEVISAVKVGQVHFIWNGKPAELREFFVQLEPILRTKTAGITANMAKRGGGITSINLEDCSYIEPGYWQIKAEFKTCNAMGANFINSVLEEFASILVSEARVWPAFGERQREVQIVMSILSNYTPESLVRASVECDVEDLGEFKGGLKAQNFAEKFYRALRIAREDPFRATTHNKGIFNGVDAVVLATGNDFRAVEACGHAYAARDGRYRSLSDAKIENGRFKFWLELPLAVGTVGGLTTLHPLAKRSMELLGNPGAEDLMKIIASVGLAQNFAALRSLVTTGIQAGHMKMHLSNILNQFAATDPEIEKALAYFANRTVSFQSVRDYLTQLRGKPVSAKS